MKSDDFGPLEFLLAGCIIGGAASLAIAIIAGIWDHLAFPLKLVIVPPYIAAIFPLPCPFWYIWYMDRPRKTKIAVLAGAAAWVALTFACLVWSARR